MSSAFIDRSHSQCSHPTYRRYCHHHHNHHYRDPPERSNLAQKEYNKLVAELNEEIERLNQTNDQLNKKLLMTENQVNVDRKNELDLENHNKALIEELCELSKQNLDLKSEHRLKLDSMGREVKHIGDEFENAMKQKHEADNQMKILKLEREKLERSLNESQKHCRLIDSDGHEMRNFLIRAEEDKKRLTQRIEKLVANERTLVLELERFKRRGGSSGGDGRSISQLDEYIKGIETDRDYWRNQVDLLQQIITCSGLVTDGSKLPLSRLKSKPPVGQYTNKFSNLSKDAKQRKFEQQIHELRCERDRLRLELDKAHRLHHRSVSPLTRSRSLNRFQKKNDCLELTRLRQERDELRTLLNTLEHRVKEIQRNVYSLTQERDHLNKLYNDSRYQIHRLHQDLHAIHETGDRSSQTTQTVLRRTEAERDRAMVDLTRVTAERDSLITKYKNANENRNSDKLRLTNQLDQLENNLNVITKERDEMFRQSTILRSRTDECEVRQQQLETSLIEHQEMLKKSNEELIKIKQDRAILETKLQEREDHMLHLEERNSLIEIETRRMREKLDDYDQKSRHDQNEVGRLHEQIVLKDDEKNRLHFEIEQLTIDRNELANKIRQLEKRSNQHLNEKDKIVKQCNELKDAKDHVERSLQILTSELSELTTKYQLEKESNEKLQERINTTLHSKASTERQANWINKQLEELKIHEEQVQNQLDQEKDQNRRLNELSEKLHGDIDMLRNTVELANKDKIHLESCIEEMSSAHRQVVREREDLVHRNGSLRERIVDLENENKLLDAEVKRNAEALRSERNAADDLQQQLELCKRRADTMEHDANEWSGRTRLVEDQLHKTETRVVQLERELRTEREDYVQLRSRQQIVEEEKQALEMNLKDANQRLSHVEIDLNSRTREFHDLRVVNDEVMRAHARTQEQLSLKSAEVTNLKDELNSMQSNLVEARRLFEVEEHEAIRLRDDLNQLARESQNMSRDLQDTTEERDELMQRNKDYLDELSRLERVLSDRDSECNKLVDQLRSSNEDAEQWRSRWESVEGKMNEWKVELEDRELELASQRERADTREREIAHLRANLNSVELQNTTASRALVDSNEQLRMVRAEIQTLTSEISRLRDLVARLETEKSNIQRDLGGHRLDNDQLRAQLDDFEIELDQIKDQLQEERLNTKNLNEMLLVSKQKEQKALHEVQERTGEVIALRERVVNADEKSELAQRDLDRIRERLSETEREATRLSRSLSAERFEKERALSELRLSTLPAGYRPSGYSGLSGSYYNRERSAAYHDRDDY